MRCQVGKMTGRQDFSEDLGGVQFEAEAARRRRKRREFGPFFCHFNEAGVRGDGFDCSTFLSKGVTVLIMGLN